MSDQPIKGRRNPLVNSKLGGRILNASQLWLLMVFPPKGYGVLTTIGSSSGKPRRRCVRVVRSGDIAVLVAIKGMRTGWLQNALAEPDVRLRMRGGFGNGQAKTLGDGVELTPARDAHISAVHTFDFLPM